jgi:capsular exopolysaccharide synthesis family protein
MDAAKFSEKPEVKLHFLDYWRVIRLRRSLILTVFLLVVLTTAAVTFWLLPEKYASFVRIEVNKESPEIDFTSGYGGHQNTMFDPYFLQTQFEVLKSSSILNGVITGLSLDQRYTRQLNLEKPLTPDETYYLLLKRMKVQQTRGTSLIEIWVYDSDRALAAEIANKIAEEYARERRRTWEENREAGIKKLKEKLNIQQVQLDATNAYVNELQIKLKMAIVGETPYSTATVESDRLRELDRLLLDARDTYVRSSNLLEKVKAIPAEKLKDSIATMVPGDLELTSLADRRNQAAAEFLAVSNTMGSAHPDYLKAQAHLDLVTRQFSNKLAGVIFAVEKRVEADKEQYETAKHNMEVATADSSEKAKLYRPFIEAKRAAENLTVMIEFLQKKLISEDIEKDMPTSLIVQVRDMAKPGLRPVSPNKPLNIVLGVLVGLMVGVGLAFFIEYLDTSVKTIDDVERSLEAPVLAVIPQQVGVLLDEGIDSPHAEAYRVLRTNLLFARKDESWNTITVLSGGAGEGKSTTLFNLATVFAQNGSRVLVVDSDLNRPSIHKMLHVANSPGLTDHLLKQVRFEDIIQTTSQENLHFLPSGKLPRTSMGILGSVQMKEVIKELKRRYDFVFFDSPPLLGVSDASVLASQMDMTLQVIQYRRYPQLMTIRAKQMILKVGGHLMGIVLNNINMSQDENYYYYSGYYEYRSKQKPGEDVKGNVAANTDGAVKTETKAGVKAEDKNENSGEIKQKY